MPRRSVAMLLATFASIALLAACAPGAAGSPTPTASSSSASSSGSSAALGPGDCGTKPAASGSDRHAAPELEALIPKTIAGVTLSAYSYREGAADADTLAPLLGKSLDTVCYAYAMPSDPSKLPTWITVYRIVGVPATQLLAPFLRSRFGLDVVPAEQAAGGKQVVVAQIVGAPMVCCSNGPVYLYAWGEALFMVTPASVDVAATALRALP